VVDGRIIDLSYEAGPGTRSEEPGHSNGSAWTWWSSRKTVAVLRPVARPAVIPLNWSGCQIRASDSSSPLTFRPRPPQKKIVAAVGDSARIYKVGVQLYTAEGPQIVRDLIASGRQVFLDLKYHDIPNTVASAVKEACRLGLSMLTVHAAGGGTMLRAAVEAARNTNASTMILAVTVLTSLDRRTGKCWRPRQRAGSGFAAGPPWPSPTDATVSYPRRKKPRRCAPNSATTFLIVTPGVRPAGTGHGDQARVVTPSEAIASGASYIVVGRPITEAEDPALEAERSSRKWL